MGTYEDLAAEYYDAKAHPTCANFREASESLLRGWVDAQDPRGWTIEVGAGRSIAAPRIMTIGKTIERLVLMDNSAAMLRHSGQWSEQGARLVVGDACCAPIGDGIAACVVASLGDPFNVPAFWQEAARILRPGGQMLFTTPSYEWASHYRSPEETTRAVFDLQDGDSVAVLSLILPPVEQVAMAESAGLVVKEVEEFLSTAATLPLSPKLVEDGTAVASVATLFVVGK